MKKLYSVAFFGLVIAAGLGFAGSTKAASINSNIITVTSCEQVGSDIRVSRNNGAKYILTSTCRDAGHGMRQYKMTCISNTKYKVEWSTSSSCTNHDITKPTISLSSDQSIVNDSETVTLTANASDDKGVTKIEILEGSIVRRTCHTTNSCTYTFTADANQNSNRTQTFTARAYDAAGNIKTSSSQTITTRAIEDNSRPTVHISTSRSQVKTGQEVTISTSASDSEGVAKIEIYQNGERVKRCSNVVECYYTENLRLSNNTNSQTYSFYMKATDMNGNSRTSNTAEVRVTR